jgi:hypothetical protein
MSATFVEISECVSGINFMGTLHLDLSPEEDDKSEERGRGHMQAGLGKNL